MFQLRFNHWFNVPSYVVLRYQIFSIIYQLRREAELTDISREEYLAATMNNLEDFLRRFDDDRAQEVIQVT